MKKFYFFTLLIFILSGCASPEKKLADGKIKIGMKKYSFCHETLSFGGDPCAATFGDGYNNKGRGLYYPRLKMEIIWAPKPKSFFVFKKVTDPINWANYGKYYYEGNGELDKVFTSKEEAIKYVTSKISITNKSTIEWAKKYCEKDGFKPGSEEFADCTLKNIKGK
jgi:hypothetical protein